MSPLTTVWKVCVPNCLPSITLDANRPDTRPASPPPMLKRVASGHELEQDVASLGAHGLADADFACALSHGDEHDVHDPDPAYQEGDPGDGAEKDDEGVGGLVQRFEGILLAGDGEVVFGRYSMAEPEDRRNLLLG